MAMWLALGATLVAAYVPNYNPEMKIDEEALQARVAVPGDQSQEQPQGPAGMNKLKVEASTRAPGAKLVGYYTLSWTSGSKGPKDADFGIAFSGWGSLEQALQSGPLSSSLQGEKFLSLGGANVNGHLSWQGLQELVNSTKTIKLFGFDGVCFDIEHTSVENKLLPAMKAAFAACKEAGLKVIVTTSHSAPLVTNNAAAFIDMWIHSTDIDIISPQLYSRGEEKEPEFATTQNIQWGRYKAAKAKIIPSLVDGTHYQKTAEYFAKIGIKIDGYIQ
jgi:hypothetical protein